MESITKLSLEALKLHEKNKDFFDDIEGEQFELFKKSINEDGILTPLIVAPDMTIISGHQRFKAAKELGLKTVPVIIREDLIDEDEKLRKLLATNFGRMKNNPVKQSRVIVEYEKLCGVKHGNNQRTRQTVVSTQEDIANQLGVDVRTLQRIKMIQNLSPEVQELIESGTISYTKALKIFYLMSKEEQAKLIEEIGKENISAISSKEIEMLQAQLKAKDAELAKEKQQYNAMVETSYKRVSSLTKEIEQLKSAEPKTVEKIVEVIPEDYNYYKDNFKRLSEASESKTDSINKLNRAINEKEQELQKKSKEVNELKANSAEIEEMKAAIEDYKRRKSNMMKDFEDYQKAYTFIKDAKEMFEKKLMVPMLLNLSQQSKDTLKEDIEMIVKAAENWAFAMKQKFEIK